MRVLSLVLLLGCSGKKSLPTATVTLGSTPLVVEVAATEDHRRTGLMNRDSMPQDRGMIFVYPSAGVRGFWMKDTRIPLSIAFIAPDGTIKRIADMRPFNLDRTSSLYPAQYAIEVNQGWFDKNGVKVGDAVTGLDTLPTADK